jgi:sporulation protein YlmC with PRC-barrel domain
LSKLMPMAALAAIALATAPIAYAQNMTAPRNETAGSMATSPTGDRIKSDEIRVSNMIGSSVYDRQNQDIGKVKDLILNKNGRIDAVVVDVGSFLGMGGKYVGVEPSKIKTDNNRLTLDMTKAQLKQARAYQLTDRDTGAGSSTSPVEGGHLGTPAQRRE